MFPSDIWNEIFEYLCYIDVMAVLHAYPTVYKYTNPKFLDARKVIERSFAKRNMEIDSLYARMNLTTGWSSAIFFGGMLIGILYDQIHPKSDIDIIHTECFTYCVNATKHKPIKHLKILRGEHQEMESEYEYDTGSRSGVWEYSYPLTLIKEEEGKAGLHYQHNTILYETDSMSEYLDENTDIPMLKVYFDGKRFHIKHIEDLFARTTNVSIGKVLKDGFRVYQMKSNWHDKTRAHLMGRIYDRIAKYRDRGFTILTGNDHADYQIINENIRLGESISINEKMTYYELGLDVARPKNRSVFIGFYDYDEATRVIYVKEGFSFINRASNIDADDARGRSLVFIRDLIFDFLSTTDLAYPPWMARMKFRRCRGEKVPCIGERLGPQYDWISWES